MRPDRPADVEVARAIALREQLHGDPELGHQEHRTAELIRAALSAVDIVGVAETGLIARVGPADGPQVVLRAELDGLPIRECTDVPWASRNGMMHACGHDVHLAALVATVRHLSAQPALPMGVAAVFQPCEEGYPSGARMLLDQGAFDGMDVAAVAAMHVHPEVPYGEVALTPGPVNAAVDMLTITVRGHDGHAAYPHAAADPVVAMASTIVALQQIVSRGVDPTHATVLTVATLQAGTVANVIPDVAVATGTLRCLHDEDRERAKGLITTCVRATAEASGCTGEVTFASEEPPLVNDPEFATATAAHLPPELRLHPLDRRSCGADDFAEYGTLGPTLMGFVGLAGHPGFVAAPLHSSRFLPPHDVIATVAAGLLAAYRGAVSLRAD